MKDKSSSFLCCVQDRVGLYDLTLPQRAPLAHLPYLLLLGVAPFEGVTSPSRNSMYHLILGVDTKTGWLVGCFDRTVRERERERERG